MKGQVFDEKRPNSFFFLFRNFFWKYKDLILDIFICILIISIYCSKISIYRE